MIWLVYLYLMCFWLSKLLLCVLFFWKHWLVKCPNLWHTLHCYFFAGHVNPSWWLVSPHLEHLLWLPEGGSLFEVGRKWLPLIFWPWCRSFLHDGLLLPCLGLVWDFFFLYLCWGSSVLWWCSKLIWATWGSPDTCFICLTVAFELSNFLANWHILLTGNLLTLMLPSLMVLDTKSSSLRKNQNMSLCSILAVSGGYLAKFTCACMALYHSSMLWFPWWKLVSRSNLAWTSLDCGLQYYLYFSHMV